MKFLFVIFLISLCVINRANSADVEQMLKNLKSPSDSIKSIALQKLLEVNDKKTYPLLAALNDRKLFVYNNLFVSYDKKFVDEKGIDQYSLVQVYPMFKVLTNKENENLAVPISELAEISISRADRLLIVPMTPQLNLVSADPEKRKLAYAQFQTSKELGILKDIKNALSVEQNAQVYRLGKESYFTILLNTSKQTDEKKLMIDSLISNWGPNTESILEQFSLTENNAEIKSYALNGAHKLAKQHDNLRVAQNIFSGLSLGSILIMIALGLSIIYGLAGVINMAHGEFLMIGAYATFCVQNLFDKNSDLFFWISIPISFLIAGIFGFIIERLIIRHLYARPLESLLATWGVSLVLVQLARTLFGDLTAVRAPALLSGGWEIVPHLVLPYNRLFIIVLSITMILLTYYVLYKTRLGLRIRAVTQNRNMSSCLGIETNKVDATTFFLGSGLAGVAGCAMTLIGNVVPDMGQNYIVDSFLVVVTGGVGNIAGSIVSGFGIGFVFKILESFFEAVYGKVFILVLIIVFLQFKPRGLFPDKGRIAED